jgi:hypothetical protein
MEETVENPLQKQGQLPYPKRILPETQPFGRNIIRKEVDQICCYASSQEEFLQVNFWGIKMNFQNG